MGAHLFADLGMVSDRRAATGGRPSAGSFGEPANAILTANSALSPCDIEAGGEYATVPYPH